MAGEILWFKTRGLEHVEGWLHSMRDRAVRALQKWLYSEALEILAEAKRLVPVDTGALRASGFVEAPTVRGTRVAVVIGFGGPSAPYAFHVHEDLKARHVVGQAKYLETPAVARLATAHDRMVAFMEGALRAAR